MSSLWLYISSQQSIRQMRRVWGQQLTYITNVLKLKMPEERVVNDLKLVTYVAVHSSTVSVDHISGLIPKLDRKSSILSNMRLHRTKFLHRHSSENCSVT